MSDLVGNPEDRFSHNEAHTKIRIYKRCRVVIWLKKRYFEGLVGMVSYTRHYPLFEYRASEGS